MKKVTLTKSLVLSSLALLLPFMGGCAAKYGASTPATPMHQISSHWERAKYQLERNAEMVRSGHPELALATGSPEQEACFIANRWAFEWLPKMVGPEWAQTKADVEAFRKQHQCPSLDVSNALNDRIRQMQSGRQPGF